MATPDLLRLYQLYDRMFGSQGSPLGSAPAERETIPRYSSDAFAGQRAIPADPYYAPTEGVPGASVFPSAVIPQWGQPFLSTGGGRLGFGPPLPFGRGIPGVPFPTSRSEVVEIPKPHLERFIPETTRDFCTAAVLMPRLLARGGRGDESQEQDERMAAPGLERRPNRPGSQPPWIVGPLIFEERERQSARGPHEQRLAEQADPNVRRLTRVLGGEGDPTVSEYSVQPRAEEMLSWQPTTPMPSAASAPNDNGKGTPRIKYSPSLAPKDDQSSGIGRCFPGGGDGGRDDGEDDHNSFCTQIWTEENGRCAERAAKRPKWRDRNVCETRAFLRNKACRDNGGLHPANLEPEWGIEDDRRSQAKIRRRNRRMGRWG